MKRTIMVVMAAMLLATGAQAASLNVNAGAAIDGNYGLEVIMNDLSLAYVVDDTPNNERVYRASFELDWNTLQMNATVGSNSWFTILMLWDLDQPGPLPRQNTMLGLQYSADLRPKIFMKIINFDGVTSSPTWRGDPDAANPFGTPMQLNLPTHPSGYPCTVIVQVTYGTPGLADGVVTMSRDNEFAPGIFLTKTYSTVQNGYLDVDLITFGAVSGISATATGSYYLDTFESYRTLITP